MGLGLGLAPNLSALRAGVRVILATSTSPFFRGHSCYINFHFFQRSFLLHQLPFLSGGIFATSTFTFSGVILATSTSTFLMGHSYYINFHFFSGSFLLHQLPLFFGVILTTPTSIFVRGHSHYTHQLPFFQGAFLLHQLPFFQGVLLLPKL